MSGHQKSKPKHSGDSTSDQACTRCRERKIRCGRELPQCNNCDRDDSATCIYQNPTKRVNHLKSLFDSVNGVKERLNNIESLLSLMTVSIPQNFEQDNSSSVGGSFDEKDDDAFQYSDECIDSHVFHNQVDMTDYYHGPMSLFVLCKRFRSCALSVCNTERAAPLQDILQNLCEKAGVLETFPPFGDQSVINLLPKQLATTIIGHFFQHVDCVTDVFVKNNLLAHVERIYSQSTEPRDDVWVICLQAITVLVWGMEISAQTGNGLFGDFARSFLPSRAALVSQRLLSTPRLINVQTLIILSVVAEQFDPPGWAEFIFTHACGLARAMGLHQAQLFPDETSAYDTLERAKVVQSLYVRDKSLCTTRGSVSWMPTHDCNIAPQINSAVDRRRPYLEKLHLARIQDDIYRLTHTASFRTSGHNNSRTAKALRSIEHQLEQYTREFGIFTCRASSYNSSRAMLTLEFLTTRILALQHGSEQRHAERLRSDARTSCLLLLIAQGVQDRQVVNAFNTLTCQRTPQSDPGENLSAIEASAVSFATVLDAFSLPAFFILLKDVLPFSENDNRSNADLELLRKVSACYTLSTERMQSNSYHRKVAWTFEQLLSISDLIKHPEKHQLASITPTTSISQVTLSQDTQAEDFFSIAPSHPIGDSSSFSWDIKSSAPSSLGLHTPFGSANSVDISEIGISDMLNQLRHGESSGSPEWSMSWSDVAPQPPNTRKRLRAHKDSDVATEKGEKVGGLSTKFC